MSGILNGPGDEFQRDTTGRLYLHVIQSAVRIEDELHKHRPFNIHDFTLTKTQAW